MNQGAGQIDARLLVVDDERINREILSRLLRRHGFEAVCAENGRQALELAESSDIDLVLLDVVMPELDGFACLQQLRTTRCVTELPVIMVTSETNRDVTVRAFQAGANDFVTKPIDPEIALARIRTHLRLRKAQADLRQSEERYALAARGANDGLWDWEIAYDRLFLSPRFREMLGYGEDELASTSNAWFSRMHAEDRSRFMALLEQSHAAGEKQFQQEMRVRHRDGGYRWMNCRGVALAGADGRPRRMSGSLTDITQGKVSDSLTGLPNRLLFRERLEQACQRAWRQPRHGFAVLFLDLDNFKLVNDGLGHQAGDTLLAGVAARLEGCVRATDAVLASDPQSTVARLGGDEFTILLQNVSRPEDAEAVAQRILEAFAEPFSLAGNEVYAGVSIGIAWSGGDERRPDDLLREADTSMYHAKKAGRRQFRAYTPDMHVEASRRLQLEHDLRKAIGGEEFFLAYQPIMHLPTNQTAGFEALVRWTRPRGECVGPHEFIPIAEETGMIVPLGNWVLREACLQAAAWNRRFTEAPPLIVNVNCSIIQLQQARFIEQVEATLSETKADPHWIKIEVTESTLMAKPEVVCPILTRLRQMGVRIGVDDFGTGYSSLAYLHRLPLDVLKVDRSFVSTMEASEESQEIVRTIITLGRSLQMDVVAEGVETETQRLLLLEMGCTHAQGYLFSKPVSAAEVERCMRGSAPADSSLQRVSSGGPLAAACAP